MNATPAMTPMPMMNSMMPMMMNGMMPMMGGMIPMMMAQIDPHHEQGRHDLRDEADGRHDAGNVHPVL
jgi:hypothetical protein